MLLQGSSSYLPELMYSRQIRTHCEMIKSVETPTSFQISLGMKNYSNFRNSNSMPLHVIVLITFSIRVA